jgi:hypothetical protein
MPIDPLALPSHLPNLLEVWRVAIVLKKSPEYVRRLIRTHQLPGIRFGSGTTLLVDERDLLAFIEAGRLTKAEKPSVQAFPTQRGA